jgi:Methyltransferase domain
MPDSHIQIPAGFGYVTFIDMSTIALAIAQRRLGPGALYLLESVVDATRPDEQLDAVFYAHTVYHIDKVEQAKAIAQMMRVTSRAVIVYANPRSNDPKGNPAMDETAGGSRAESPRCTIIAVLPGVSAALVASLRDRVPSHVPALGGDRQRPCEGGPSKR